MMRFLTALSLTVALFAFQTAARADNQEDFVKKAASASMAEVMLGKLAGQNSESPDVKKLGERLVKDHTQATEELKQLAEKKGWQLSNQPMKEHQEHVEYMKTLKGAEFDRAFVKH